MRSGGMSGWIQDDPVARRGRCRAGPARPVSWVKSPGVISSCRSPVNFISRSITTVFAGMLIPSESVSVREHGLDEAALEQLLDGLLEQRDQPGVVRRDAAGRALEPVVVAEDRVILDGEHGRSHLDVLADPLALVLRRRAGRPPRRQRRTD